jgi:hypothetical protein
MTATITEPVAAAASVHEGVTGSLSAAVSRSAGPR